MCNACGFQCCAYDGFSKCGCDHCDNPACWDGVDELDDDFDGDDGYGELATDDAEDQEGVAP